jgi:hypothetical protein
MKAKAFLASLTVLFLLTSCGNSGSKSKSKAGSTNTVSTSANGDVSASVVKKYQIKSGIVTFYNEGMGMKTKRVLYFEDFGMKELEENFEEDAIKDATLCDGKNRYTIVYNDKTAYEEGVCFHGVAYRFDWSEVERSPAEYKPKKLPNIVIADKECESFSIQSGGTPIVYAGWNNVCLMIDQNTPFGRITYMAVMVEENATIPAEKFAVPAGFTIKKAQL